MITDCSKTRAAIVLSSLMEKSHNPSHFQHCPSWKAMPQKVNQFWHTLIESHKKPIHSFLSSLSHSCIHITNGLTLKFGSFSSSTLLSARLIASFWYSYMGMGFWSALKLLHPCSIKMAKLKDIFCFLLALLVAASGK